MQEEWGILVHIAICNSCSGFSQSLKSLQFNPKVPEYLQFFCYPSRKMAQAAKSHWCYQGPRSVGGRPNLEGVPSSHQQDLDQHKIQLLMSESIARSSVANAYLLYGRVVAIKCSLGAGRSGSSTKNVCYKDHQIYQSTWSSCLPSYHASITK